MSLVTANIYLGLQDTFIRYTFVKNKNGQNRKNDCLYHNFIINSIIYSNK